MLSAICFNLDQSKILLSGNGLIKLILSIDDCHLGRIHPYLATRHFLPVHMGKQALVCRKNDAKEW